MQAPRRDSVAAKKDSMPHLGDMAYQFLAGEVAFNITSFTLWGNDLYTASRSDNGLGIVGIMASFVTVPLTIDLTSELLGLKNGSVGASVASAFGSVFLVTFPLLLVDRPPTYLKNYLFLSLPIITVAQLVYDLTMPGAQ